MTFKIINSFSEAHFYCFSGYIHTAQCTVQKGVGWGGGHINKGYLCSYQVSTKFVCAA